MIKYRIVELTEGKYKYRIDALVTQYPKMFWKVVANAYTMESAQAHVKVMEDWEKDKESRLDGEYDTYGPL